MQRRRGVRRCNQWKRDEYDKSSQNKSSLRLSPLAPKVAVGHPKEKDEGQHILLNDEAQAPTRRDTPHGHSPSDRQPIRDEWKPQAAFTNDGSRIGQLEPRQTASAEDVCYRRLNWTWCMRSGMSYNEGI